MKCKLWPAMLCTVLAIGFSSLGADAPKTQPVKTKSVAELIEGYIRQAGSDDPVQVQAALIGLSMASPDEFPQIEAAVANPAIGAKAAASLKKFMEQQRPLQAPRKRMLKNARVGWDWQRTAALAAYEKAGKKDPKLDADVVETIKLFHTPGMSAYTPLKRLVDAKCDDAMIAYLRVRVVEIMEPGNLPAINRLYQRATKLLSESNYPAYFKASCYAREYRCHLSTLAALRRGINSTQYKDLESLLSREAAEWPLAIAEHPPAGLLLETANTMLDAADSLPDNRKKIFDSLYEPWQKATPDASDVLTFKGRFYTQFAWDARGGGWANSVTDEGWKLFGDRLEIANKALTQAWEKDHDNELAAVQMIKVALGQGSNRSIMELWYRRAMEANPDSDAAVMQKMAYLLPRWHGSEEDMIIFGHQLVETQNWRGALPYLLATIYENIAVDSGNVEAVFSKPEVWKDIQSIFIPALTCFPANDAVRSTYCFYASQGGHWDIAKQQFDILGPRVVAGQFGGTEQMLAFKAQAMAKGAAGAP